MTVQTIRYACPCGTEASTYNCVGLTEDHQLCVQWICEGCGHVVYALKPLTECWNECPSLGRMIAQNILESAAKNMGTQFTAEDEAFLKAIHAPFQGGD